LNLDRPEIRLLVSQLIAPADDARLGFSEIKLVIIDTARSSKLAS
jgi:hypothetical protein